MNGIIYVATNLINRKIYIGQTTQKFQYRITSHKNRARRLKNVKSDYLLYRAIRKYGFSNFKWEVIEECRDSDLNDREVFYIKQYNSYAPDKNSHGYNMTRGGDNYFGSCGKYHYLNQFTPSERKRWLSKHRDGVNNPNYGNGGKLCGENHFSKHMSKVEYDAWTASISGDNNYQQKLTPEELNEKCWINHLSEEEKERWIIKSVAGNNNPFKKAYLKNPDKYRGRNNPLYGTTNVAAYKEYIVTFPDGNVAKICGLRPFCKKHNLSPSLMAATAGGFQKTHRKFQCRHATAEDNNIPLYSEIHIDPTKATRTFPNKV
jgi:group I intron endonuclease